MRSILIGNSFNIIQNKIIKCNNIKKLYDLNFDNKYYKK